MEASAAVLQTDTADLHVSLGSRQITELPLPGYRNYQTLINLVPGATPANYQNAVSGSPGRSLNTNINGASNTSNNTRLDGALNMRGTLPAQSLYVPPAESIQTVNIATNNFDAEQGLAGGAAINVITKSGTNQIHGVVFEHHTNGRLTARNFFNLSSSTLPKDIINNYGGAVGGPIRKNKLFYFVSWEGMKERSNFTKLATVPTDAAARRKFQRPERQPLRSGHRQSGRHRTHAVRRQHHSRESAEPDHSPDAGADSGAESARDRVELFRFRPGQLQSRQRRREDQLEPVGQDLPLDQVQRHEGAGDATASASVRPAASA